MLASTPTPRPGTDLGHVGALIVAAGRGTRMGGSVPKQYQVLAGEMVVAHTLRRLSAHPGIDALVLVIHPDDTARARTAIAQAAGDRTVRREVVLAHGGDTRAASVARGLAAFGPGIEKVLIHDAARPFVEDRIIDDVLDALRTHPAAAPALQVTDALWRDTGLGAVDRAVPRAGLWRAQTPQGFDLAAIRAAHATAPADAADDVEVARAAGLEVRIIAGAEENFKLTRPQDMERAEKALGHRGNAMDLRLGNGYDVHRFGPGKGVVLCGVEVPHDRALQGHSDADVGMHAVTDALYGALAEGDIGRHFPPSDPQWKGAASEIFLRHAAERVATRGYRICNVDCTLVCERPKIGPHAPAMQARMAQIMGIAPEQVSVKATTSEQIGFAGREEGIAALATAALMRVTP